jgi:hypothetical protein
MLPFGRDRAAMAGGVDSPSHAADSHQSLRCQAAAALRDCPEPITPRAGRKFLSAVVGNEYPLSSPVTIVTPPLAAREISSRANSADSPLANRLRRHGLDPRAFQLRERCLEERFRAAEVFHQFQRLRWPPALRQRDGEPFQNMGCGSGYGIRQVSTPFSLTGRTGVIRGMECQGKPAQCLIKDVC